MSKPRMECEMLFDRCAPRCPHCREEMDEAQISLSKLLDAWPLDEFIPVDSEGYAHPNDYSLSVDCPSCKRTMAVAIDGVQVKLIAAITEKDELLMGAR